MAVGDKLPVVMGAEKAVAGGVATLGPDGVLSEEQRPSVDAVPTEGSSSPVQSGGVYSALSNKADRKLSNLETPQLALANLGAGVRPNIADNAYFAGGGSQQNGEQLPVNQQGETQWESSSSNVRLFDRWAMQVNNAQATAQLTSSGLELSFTGINQTIFQTFEPYKFKAGETYTSSIMVDGILYEATLIASTSEASAAQYQGAEFSCALQYLEGNWLWYPLVDYRTTPRTLSVSACKIEELEGQTLAYQDSTGTWQLLPQPDMDYRTQLAKCLPYFVSSYQNASPGTPNSYTNEIVLVAVTINYFSQRNVEFPTRMRTTPSVTFYAPGSGDIGKATKAGGDDVDVAMIIAGQDRISFYAPNNDLTVGSEYYLHYTASAEL